MGHTDGGPLSASAQGCVGFELLLRPPAALRRPRLPHPTHTVRRYLCSDETALGPADFAAIAKNYHTVCIVGIPKMGLINRHETRRFISLIDELYQYKVWG